MRHVPADKFGAFPPSSSILAKIKGGMSGRVKCSQGGNERRMKEEAVGGVFENTRNMMIDACFNDVGGCSSSGVTLLDAVRGFWGEIWDPQDVGLRADAAPGGPRGSSSGLTPAVARSSEPNGRNALRGSPLLYKPLNAWLGNVTVAAKLDVKPQQVLKAAREPAGTTKKLKHYLMLVKNSFGTSFAEHSLQLLAHCSVKRSLVQATINFTLVQLPPQAAALTNFVGILRGSQKHSCSEVVMYWPSSTTGPGSLLISFCARVALPCLARDASLL